MMDDKELLTLAAKAAGYKLDGLASKHIAQGVGPDDFLLINEKGGHSVWRPLTNNGDALQLAVDLDMDINRFVQTGEVAAVQHRPKDSYKRCFERIRPGQDKHAATRRCIVRAAAEIGRGM